MPPRFQTIGRPSAWPPFGLVDFPRFIQDCYSDCMGTFFTACRRHGSALFSSHPFQTVQLELRHEFLSSWKHFEYMAAVTRTFPKTKIFSSTYQAAGLRSSQSLRDHFITFPSLSVGTQIKQCFFLTKRLPTWQSSPWVRHLLNPKTSSAA